MASRAASSSVPADRRERRPVEIDERRSDRRPAVKRLQSGAIERELGDVGRGRAIGLFAQFEVDDQYTLVGCDKPVETAAIGKIRTSRPRQKPRQRRLRRGSRGQKEGSVQARRSLPGPSRRAPRALIRRARRPRLEIRRRRARAAFGRKAGSISSSACASRPSRARSRSPPPTPPAREGLSGARRPRAPPWRRASRAGRRGRGRARFLPPSA